MKFSISSIAWLPKEETEVANLFREFKIDSVEIAPSLRWPEPVESTKEQRLEYRHFWESRNVQIYSMQSLLFTQPNLNLLGDKPDEFVSYIKKVIDLGSDLGASILVFGSPKNRRRGEMPLALATQKATPHLRKIGEYAEKKGICFCIEPNPPVYACDFINTSQEGQLLVGAVSSKGFFLHLDMGGCHLAGESFEKAFQTAQPMVKHVHLSAVNLENPIFEKNIPYLENLTGLKKLSYSGVVSVEMRAQKPENNPQIVREIFQWLKNLQSNLPY